MGWAAAAMGAAQLGGNILSSSSSQHANESALKHSVQWRVQDARKAGIHPLYALGAPTMQLGAMPVDFSPLADIGQNIDRAMEAARDRKERNSARNSRIMGGTSAIQSQADALQLENMGLQNDLLRSQISRLSADQVPPSFPAMGAMTDIPGQGDMRVQPIPATPVINAPGRSGQEAGVITDYGFARQADGGLTIVPSNDVKNRIEDSPMEWEWFWRNRVVPAFTGNPQARPSSSDYPLPQGTQWRYSRVRGAFYPYDPVLNRFLVGGRWESGTPADRQGR